MTALIVPGNSAIAGITNPFGSADHSLASWFHAQLTRSFVIVLRIFTELGANEWVGAVLLCAVLFFIFKRWWPSLVTLIVAVPGGIMLNEWVKVLVHRHRPFVALSSTGRGTVSPVAIRSARRYFMGSWLSF
jgi:hypothetical protein